MIVHNDFKEFQSVAEEIDKRLYYTNLIIKRGKKDDTPVNKSGEIIINDTQDEGYFGGELVHEAGHTIFDPVSAYNWVTCVSEVKKRLDVSRETATLLSCIATDLIVGWKVRDDPVLNDYRRRSIEVLYDELYEKADPIRKELFGIRKEMHGCKFEAETRLYEKVKRVLKRKVARKEKYVELARVFHRLLEREVCEPLGDTVINFPFKICGEDVWRLAQQLLMESDDVEDADEKIKILAVIVDDPKDLDKVSSNILKSFFEAKARLVQMSMAYPMERTQRGVKVGSKRWRMEHGLRAIDVKRTVMKYGVSIPLVTTQTPRILQKFISSMESQKPCDLVVSIDTSGSTGDPHGTMEEVADYEVVMFYALVNLAKRLDQRIGLTLWAGSLYYTTLPETYDWRRSERLKREILSNWSGMTTTIFYALRQAEDNPDKLFFIFTDGEVNQRDLFDVENVIFFLIKPVNYNHRMFVEKYGEGRVVKIDSLDRIPKVAVQQYVKLFME